MPLTFGTDGVRGVANADVAPELVLALGRAAARVLGSGPWIIGRDTRISGPMLTAALAAGLTAEGGDVIDLGVTPTPAVAAACAARGLPGAVISASHNPFHDNGVKLFASGGRKLSDDVERAIEDELADPVQGGRVGAAVGRMSVEPDARDEYARHLLDALEGRGLDGREVVLDCANGAASFVAGDLFRHAGAVVTVMHVNPDGTNINQDCGSTYPESLQEAVRAKGGRAVGLAFDGDADRVLAVDETGELIDGDQILALAALDLRARRRLSHDALVVTVMSNLGLKLAMESTGIQVVETPVGDRYVLEAMAAGGYSLGGEQSGHIIFGELATTGDGLLTGLLLIDLLNRQSLPLSQLVARTMQRLPQVLINVRVADPSSLESAEVVWKQASEIEQSLAGQGRVLIRPSGTEPLVRVMVEAPTIEAAEEAARVVARTVKEALGS